MPITKLRERYVTPKKLSPAKISEVRRRVAAGGERKAIAKAFGISRQTLYSYAGDIAAAHPYRYQFTPKLTPQQADELRRRVRNGEVRGKVAQAFDISRNTLYRYMRQEGADG
jgi:DNA invertase Pin-like site-specific DNA recombinase